MNYTLVAGPVRSGTTMLTQMLSGDGVLANIPECSIITNIVELYYNNITNGEERRFRAYCRDRATAANIFRDFILRFIDTATANIEGLNDVVLKDPIITCWLPSAMEIFPDHARTIIIVRDPLDVLSSLKEIRHRQNTNFNIDDDMTYIFNFYYHIIEFMKIADKRCLFVRYEDIVRRIPAVIEAIERFIGRPLVFSGGPSRDWNKADPTYVPLYGDPVTSERVGRYATVLNEYEIKKISDVFSGIRQNFGYL